MRRVARHLFAVSLALSLLLFVAAACLWGRGYFASDRIFWQFFEDEGDRSYWTQDTVLAGRGGIGMNRVVQSRERDVEAGQPGWPASYRSRQFPFHQRSVPAYPYFHVGVGDDPVWGGFKLGSFAHPDVPPARPRPRAYGWQLVVPYWAVCLATAVFPTAWLLRARARRERDRAGLCRRCGYDLRESPVRCPECGTSTATSTVSA